jgi:hypothetical protein
MLQKISFKINRILTYNTNVDTCWAMQYWHIYVLILLKMIQNLDRNIKPTLHKAIRYYKNIKSVNFIIIFLFDGQ